MSEIHRKQDIVLFRNRERKLSIDAAASSGTLFLSPFLPFVAGPYVSNNTMNPSVFSSVIARKIRESTENTDLPQLILDTA